MTRTRGQDGQTSVELMLLLPLLLLVGMALWQVQMTLSVANDAENAARTASRSGGGAEAARKALEPQYRDRVTRCTADAAPECGIQVSGRRVQVWVDVPLVVPGAKPLGLAYKVHGEADMPDGL